MAGAAGGAGLGLFGGVLDAAIGKPFQIDTEIDQARFEEEVLKAPLDDIQMQAAGSSFAGNTGNGGGNPLGAGKGCFNCGKQRGDHPNGQYCPKKGGGGKDMKTRGPKQQGRGKDNWKKTRRNE